MLICQLCNRNRRESSVFLTTTVLIDALVVVNAGVVDVSPFKVCKGVDADSLFVVIEEVDVGVLIIVITEVELGRPLRRGKQAPSFSDYRGRCMPL